MKAVVQRVTACSVVIAGEVHSSIESGLAILLGISKEDTIEQVEYLAKKCGQLRIFDDSEGRLNLSVKDISGQIMVVSNFTLYGNCISGRRPSFIEAARPELAIPLYELFIEKVKEYSGVAVESGVFGGDMQMNIINDGPITIVMETSVMMSQYK